ncbi:MAG TPA: YcnI family protein [Verrucomicrobiae bacterium]|nr:YcnI family protein [Verrucomicrobiae bacterium]
MIIPRFLASGILALTFSVSGVSAHVVVRPAEVAPAAFQTFTMGVPNEKAVPTTFVRLVVPSGLKHVSPTVKPGWAIEVKKEGEGESAAITEISWSGGSIPAGQRDDFTFSAQAPVAEGELQWKAYQTYEGGEVVAWDQAPTGGHGDSEVKPYSATAVVETASSPDSGAPYQWLSLVSAALALIALGFSLRKA